VAATAEGEADAMADTTDPEGKDDTGIDDPWKLPKRDVVESGSSLNGSLTDVAAR
jgi:hypothetical protein